jgi:putative redox protein
MQARTTWAKKMKFVGEAEGHAIVLDAKAPFGDNAALTPKALVAIAAAGCTGMDVVALMKKHKQPLEGLEIDVEAPTVEKTQPPVFKEITLTFNFSGQLEPDTVLESVRLSQTRFCAVSAMLSAAVPVRYKIMLNGEEIGSGEAKFEKQN